MEFRIFGIWGHPIGLPLADPAAIATYKLPPMPLASGEEFERAKADTARQKQRWYTVGGGGSIFEKLCSIRGFEDTLADVQMDTPEINLIADRLVEYNLAMIHRSLALDVDAVAFGDDFGTQQAMIFPLPVWRRFFRPRYEIMFAPIRKAGKKIFFHCCGHIHELLDDFAALGMNALWPQLPLFDLPELARRGRQLKIAMQLHPDRGESLQRRPPAEVRDYVRRLIDTFRTRDGGGWLYLEVDPGFPWPNVEALFQTAMELKNGS